MLTALGMTQALQRAQALARQRRQTAAPALEGHGMNPRPIRAPSPGNPLPPDQGQGPPHGLPSIPARLTTDQAMSNVYPFAPAAPDERQSNHNALLAPVIRRDLAELNAQRRADARRRLERNAGFARIPTKYVGMNFDDYQVIHPEQGQADALQLCSDFASQFERVRESGSNLILCGTTGTGKTALACIIIQRLFEFGYTGLYTAHESMRLRIRASYDASASHTETEAISAYLAPDLLVIDEYEKAKGNAETVRKDLHCVIDGRYSERKPTILVSNWHPDRIKQTLGPALWGRMTGQADQSQLLIMNWPDYRQPR